MTEASRTHFSAIPEQVLILYMSCRACDSSVLSNSLTLKLFQGWKEEQLRNKHNSCLPMRLSALQMKPKNTRTTATHVLKNYVTQKIYKR